MLQTLSISNLSLQYISATQPLIENLSVVLSSGWTGIVGANGIGKTSLLKAVMQNISPNEYNEKWMLSGQISGPEPFYYCPQRTDTLPAETDDYLAALYEKENSAGKLFGLLDLGHDWPYCWNTLSFGERKRFQLAVALWKNPAILAVDEPSNHLDLDARNHIASALEKFKGIGLIVSHDRALLDRLCDSTLFLSKYNSILVPGGFSAGTEELEKNRLHKQREYQKAQHEIAALRKEAVKRRELAANQQKRRSKKGLAIKDHDARFKKNLARISGKDGVGGKLLRQMNGRMQQAEQKLNSIHTEKRNKTGITIQSCSISRDLIITIPEGDIVLNENKLLKHPELVLHPGERIALTGRNGAGKTTLLHSALETSLIAEDDVLYIPQDISLQKQMELHKQFQAMDSRRKGEIVSIVSRLGSDPRQIIESRCFSPGEARKIFLAMGLYNHPQLIVLDEPTNHMDLPSITAIEEALSKLDCAFLIISHDEKFRNTLTNIEWHINVSAHNNELIIM